jgi:hypothetical protein
MIQNEEATFSHFLDVVELTSKHPLLQLLLSQATQFVG